MASALTDVNTALSREPNNSAFLEQRSGIQEQLCRLSDAVEDLRQAITHTIPPIDEARM